MTDTFNIGIEFQSVLTAISKQIYDTPLAFIRENVQNAVDAIRIQSTREGEHSDHSLEVHVTASPNQIEIRDNGIGMTLDELKDLFWTIGASGKRTEEAKAAGCVGMFGIGGFANFGVCSELSVTSQVSDEGSGHKTELARADIEEAGGSTPQVSLGESNDAAPRGTVVKGTMNAPIDVGQLEEYLRGFVMYVKEYIYFNDDLISRRPYKMLRHQEDKLKILSTNKQEWAHGDIRVKGQMYEERHHTLCVKLTDIYIQGSSGRLNGLLRFENGAIDILKRGFKLCTTTVSTQIGISGSLDCDQFSPTAGRDSLDPESSALLSSIVSTMEQAAVSEVLTSSERITQHTRIFPYIRRNNLIEKIGKTIVELADGSESTLTDVRQRSSGGVRVFFLKSRNQQLAHLLQARGHIVVKLPYDAHKQQAIRGFLSRFCSGESLEGRIECLEKYDDLTRFEKYFLSELEESIHRAFGIKTANLVAGRLSEDIPVCVHKNKNRTLTIYVDVRHPEISKLKVLGIDSLFRSMVAAFCREYLSPTLKTHSPRFFGNGAINLDFLSKRRSEMWLLVNDDIEILTRGTQRQVVRSTDVQIVQAGVENIEQSLEPENNVNNKPKLVRIIGSNEFAYLFGYYIRIPESATAAYGDIIQQCEDRAALWAGNKITLFASDRISTAFQFDIRLDRLITTSDTTNGEGSGAIQMEPPVQALYEGLYFPIPKKLEPYLIPASNQEIRIEVHCEWTDYSSARTWVGAAENSV